MNPRKTGALSGARSKAIAPAGNAWRRACLTAIALVLPAFAADKTEIAVRADQAWTDSGIDVKAGDLLTFDATGTIAVDAEHVCGPEGLGRAWSDLLMQYPMMNSGRGALIGRVTDRPSSRPFFIGSHAQRTATIDGRLFLGINQQPGQLGEGVFHVGFERTKALQKTADFAVRLPIFSQALLDRLPVRVSDALGNAGDRINFIVIGSREKLQTALAEAGWVVVDKTRTEAVLHGLLSSLSKEGYVTMPMSPLQVFGRDQDFGYAQADPLQVIASRHHFRLWKAPFEAGSQEVWVGAGTHDVGFERDGRNNGVTHRIDPATDGERDYIGQTLADSGWSLKQEYMVPSNAIKEARTATGGSFTSDGRTLIIYLPLD